MSLQQHHSRDFDLDHVEDHDAVDELHLAALAGWCVAGALAWAGLILATGLVVGWLGERA